MSSDRFSADIWIFQSGFIIDPFRQILIVIDKERKLRWSWPIVVSTWGSVVLRINLVHHVAWNPFHHSRLIHLLFLFFGIKIQKSLIHHSGGPDLIILEQFLVALNIISDVSQDISVAVDSLGIVLLLSADQNFD